jgi:hypothetical protein
VIVSEDTERDIRRDKKGGGADAERAGSRDVVLISCFCLICLFYKEKVV